MFEGCVSFSFTVDDWNHVVFHKRHYHEHCPWWIQCLSVGRPTLSEHWETLRRSDEWQRQFLLGEQFIISSANIVSDDHAYFLFTEFNEENVCGTPSWADFDPQTPVSDSRTKHLEPAVHTQKGLAAVFGGLSLFWGGGDMRMDLVSQSCKSPLHVLLLFDDANVSVIHCRYKKK